MSIAANKPLFFLFLASLMAVTLLVARPLTSLAQSDYQYQEDCLEVTVRAEVGDNDNGGVEVEHRWVCSGVEISGLTICPTSWPTCLKAMTHPMTLKPFQRTPVPVI